MFAKRSKNQAIFVAVGLALSFSLMGVWIRMMQDSFDTFQQVYLRILLAGLTARFIFRKKLSKNLFGAISRKEWVVYGARGFMAFTIGVGFYTKAVQHTSLAMVSFIGALPILGLLAWLMFREKIPIRSLLPIGLSIIGLFLLTGMSLGAISLGYGEIAAIVGMLGFDVGYLMSRMHSKKRNNFENTTILLLISWIPLFVLSIIQREGVLPHHLSLQAVIGLVMSVISNVAGLYAINYVFANLKAYVAGNILLLDGVFSLLLGLVFYGEPLATGVVLGGALIVASAVMINNINKTNEAVTDPLIDSVE